MGRLAAVKLLLPAMCESKEAVTRFFNEARATARIKHPGIVDILDCARMPNGQAYLVMEYLEGETLGAYVARHGKMSKDAEVARAIVRQVAAALAAAHDRGIIHRDLKPDNVFLVSEAGATDVATVKVLDFGIAKLVQGDKAPFAVTTTKELLGTPVYISPEQCKGARDLDHRTDIYSLGCIAFEMLTGAPVFVAHSLGELIASHMFKAPPSIVANEPSVPPAFAELVLRMLAKAPQDRPGTMDEVVAAIDAEGVPSALRGATVALSPGRPLEMTRGEAQGPGVPTLSVGQYESHPSAVASPESGLGALAAPSDAGERRRPSRRRLALALGGGAVALAAVIALVAGASSDDAEPAPAPAVAAAVPAPAPPPAPTVQIDVEDAPAGLKVLVDGKASPLPVTLPRGPEAHTLAFEAEGYEPMTRSLDGGKSRTLVLGMRRVPPPPVEAASPKKTPGKKPAATGKRKTDLFLDL